MYINDYLKMAILDFQHFLNTRLDIWYCSLDHLENWSFTNDVIGLGPVYKGRPANGEGVVLKFRTFPDAGRGWFVKIRTSENF